MAGTLDTAHTLAEGPFQGWTYGSKASERQVDCVQFMVAVIEESVGRPLTLAERNVINIHHGWSAEEVQTKASAGEDPLVSGLAHGLVDLMQVATRVTAAEAQVADFVQYWKRNDKGQWFGHASLLSAVSDGKATLYGSHKSTNGIAESDFELVLDGEDRHVFLVRLKENVDKGSQFSRDGTLWLPGRTASPEQPGTFTFKYPRWGMVDVKPILTKPGDYTLHVLDQEHVGKAAEAEKPLRVYFPKAEEYTITLTTTAPIHALALLPAPEGREDLVEMDGKVVLSSSDATVRGQMLRYEPNPKKLCLGFWTNPHDKAEWRFAIAQPGTFAVEIDLGCGEGHGGSEAYVASGDQSLTFTVEDTGHFQNFVTRSLGTLTFAEAGNHSITVGALRKAKAAVMDVREVRLIRQP